MTDLIQRFEELVLENFLVRKELHLARVEIDRLNACIQGETEAEETEDA